MEVPSLAALCVKAVPSSPLPPAAPSRASGQIAEALPLDLPLHLAALLVPAGSAYWQRRAAELWRRCDRAAHGGSWKQLCLERNLQEALERHDAGDDMAELRRLLALSRPQRLELRRLPAHLDLQLLFEAMHHTPACLAISCGTQPTGAGYDGPPLGLRAADVARLARVLAHPDCLLVSLDVSHNGLNDDAARMLASGLADNSSVTHVNLSGNRVSDAGARALARLLGERSVIRALDLSDNELRPDSGRALARALRRSHALTSLCLRLNRLGDQGVAAVCGALCPCPSGGASITAAPLQHLNISSNAASMGAAAAMCSMLRSCHTLHALDACGNCFGERMGLELLAAVADSTGLMHMDVRGCGLGAQAERGVSQELLARRERRDRGKLLAAAPL